MLNIVRPVKLDIHVVFTLFEMLILFPGVTILAHFAVFVDEILLFSVSVLDPRND